MVNNCTVAITKGPNKGRLCMDVHRWCKHKSIYCSVCKKSFKYQHTFRAHACDGNKIKLSIKPKTPTRNVAPAHPTVVTPETHTSERQGSEEDLREIVSELRRELDEIKNQPRVQINNLTVVADDIFTRIVSTMGRDQAVKYLLDTLGNESDCLNIVDRVYLNGRDRDQYPIACKDNNHFRFLGPGRTVVDDVGGEIIVSRLTNSVQNACLQASSNLIDAHINDSSTSMYSMYDLVSVQDKIKKLPLHDQKAKLREELADRVSNPSHPFFQLEE